MAFEHYVSSGGQRLRMGYTTGTCAALAAQGAALYYITGIKPDRVSLYTPKGLEVNMEPDVILKEQDSCVCAVHKDAGDDKDVTQGLLIYARVTSNNKGVITIKGGDGVGIVTKPGLDQPVGEAAINSTPRRMITEEVQKVCDDNEYVKGLDVEIFVPGGVEAAKKTFNPHLGIEGGISILGTSGIVEPMSMKAFSDSVCLEIRQKAAEGYKHLILTPGNYGMSFLKEKGYDASGVPVVTISNFVGDALDEAIVQGFESVLLIGHIGKLVKLAGGIMNTHSSYADCRTELFVTYAAIEGANPDICKRLLECATTDACLDILIENGLKDKVMEHIIKASQGHLDRRTHGEVRTGVIMFSNVHGYLGESDSVKDILAE